MNARRLLAACKHSSCASRYSFSSLKSPSINVSNYPTQITASFDSPTAVELGLSSGNEPAKVRCYNCGQMGHISYDCKSPQMKKACYTCGNQGHLSRDCPKRPRTMVCLECKQVGHLASTCPNSARS